MRVHPRIALATAMAIVGATALLGGASGPAGASTSIDAYAWWGVEQQNATSPTSVVNPPVTSPVPTTTTSVPGPVATSTTVQSPTGITLPPPPTVPPLPSTSTTVTAPEPVPHPPKQPEPPNIPPDGMFVELGPHNSTYDASQGAPPPLEPTAVAAVRFIVDEGADATLQLDVAPGFSSIDPSDPNFTRSVPLQACFPDPSSPSWDPVEFGRWDNRPVWDCSSGVDGVAELSGQAMSWQIPAQDQVVPGILDVILVPANSLPSTPQHDPPDPNHPPTTAPPPPDANQASKPFRVAFLKPTEANLETVGGISSDEGAGGSGDFALFDNGSGNLDAAFAGDFVATGFGGNFGSALAPGAGSRRGIGGARRAGIGFLLPKDKRLQRIMAVALLFALTAAWWWVGGQPTRAPRLLGSIGSSEAPPPAIKLGGVGRFARARIGLPQRL